MGVKKMSFYSEDDEEDDEDEGEGENPIIDQKTNTRVEKTKSIAKISHTDDKEEDTKSNTKHQGNVNKDDKCEEEKSKSWDFIKPAKRYRGSVRYEKARKEVTVRCPETIPTRLKPLTHLGSFKIKDYGTLEHATIVATAARDWYSDRRGWTKPPLKVNGRTISFRRHFAGFFDGDGTICVSPGNGLRIGISQSSADDNCPSIFIILKREYGGNIIECKARNIEFKETRKKAYEWVLTGQLAVQALRDISDYGIIKKPQADVVLDFLKQNKAKMNSIQLRLGKKRVVKQLQKLLTTLKNEHHLIKIDKTRLVDEYLAGLADAEGCAELTGLSGKTTYERFSIAQASCPDLLQAIMSKFPDGAHIANNITVIWSGPRAAPIMRRFLPYLIVKRTQVVKSLTYMEERREEQPAHTNNPISAERKRKDAEAKLVMHRLKGNKRRIKEHEGNIPILYPVKKPRIESTLPSGKAKNIDSVVEPTGADRFEALLSQLASTPNKKRNSIK